MLRAGRLCPESTAAQTLLRLRCRLSAVALLVLSSSRTLCAAGFPSLSCPSLAAVLVCCSLRHLSRCICTDRWSLPELVPLPAVMGKRKEKEKKKLHSERTAAKQAQKANKNLLKEVGEDSIDKILADLASHDKQLTAVTVSPPLVSPPSPRSNCSWLAHPTKPLLVLYGGEYYDGRTTHVYNNLYLFDTRKCEWKEVSCPSQPVARSAHQAVIMLRGEGEPLMYLFGGEYQSPSASQFHHFNQLYTLSLDTYSFTLLTPATSPPARSGHRMLGYGGRYLLMFGGFHDDGREIRHYNDLWQFDCRDEEWRCLSKDKERKADVDNRNRWPEPRSGFCFWVDDDKDTAYLYGGVTLIKEQKAGSVAGKKGKGGRLVEKEVQLTDLWSLSLSTWQWTLVKRKGIFPNERSGMACAAVSVGGKRRAALFGGVSDEKQEKKERVKEKSREDKKGKGGKKRSKAEEDEGDEDEEDEDDDEERSIHYNDMFVFNMDTQHFHYANTKGRVITDYQQSVAKKKDKATVNKDDEGNEGKDKDAATASSVFDFNPVLDALPPPPTTTAASASAVPLSSSTAVPCPAPRRSAALCVKDGVLWLYSGVVEGAGGREHTYSDVWSLELGRDEWRQVQADVEGEQWMGSDDEKDEDDETEAETAQGKEKQEDGKEEGEDEAEAEVDETEEEGGEAMQEQVADDGEQTGDSSATDGTPRVESGESAAEYFARTKEHWMQRAKDSSSSTTVTIIDSGADDGNEAEKPAATTSAKELRKAAFALATGHYEDSSE